MTLKLADVVRICGTHLNQPPPEMGNPFLWPVVGKFLLVDQDELAGVRDQELRGDAADGIST